MGFFGRLFRGSGSAAMRTMTKIVGETHIYVTDAKCVDSSDDYIGVVEELAKISDGALVPVSIETDGDDERVLRIRTRAGVVRGMLEDSRWIDRDGLLAVLNRAVRASNGRFVVFDGTGDGCMSFAFGTRAQLTAAEKKGVVFDGAIDAIFEDDSPNETTGEKTMKDIVGAGRVLVIDDPDLRRPDDVVALVHSLAAITGGAFVPERVVCTKDSESTTCDLLFETRGRIVGGTFDLDLGLDDEMLLGILNDAIRQQRERFAVFEVDGERALAFGTTAQFATAVERGFFFETDLDELWAAREAHAVPLYAHATDDARSARIAVSDDGQLVATLAGGRVRIWNRRTFELEDRAVTGATCIAFDARGELLVGTESGVRRGEVVLGTRPVTAIARADQLLAVGARIDEGDGRVEIWNLNTRERVAEWSATVDEIAISPAGDAVATGDDHDVIVWNIDGTKRFDHEIDDRCWGLAFSPDGNRLAIGEMVVKVVDAADDREIVEHQIVDGFAIDFSPDGTFVVFAADTEVTILSATELDERSMSFDEGADIYAVKWLPTGDIVSTGRPSGREQRLWLWSPS